MLYDVFRLQAKEKIDCRYPVDFSLLSCYPLTYAVDISLTWKQSLVTTLSFLLFAILFAVWADVALPYVRNDKFLRNVFYVIKLLNSPLLFKSVYGSLIIYFLQTSERSSSKFIKINSKHCERCIAYAVDSFSVTARSSRYVPNIDLLWQRCKYFMPKP